MPIHLDTNQLIGLGKRGSTAQQRIDQWIRAGESLVTSAIAWAEFLCGPLTPSEKVTSEALLTAILPLDSVTAGLGATLFNASGRRSRSLPDCLIAATALMHQSPLATENRGDFLHFAAHGLVII
jgi:predicted nucleic acid-binding protein